jgi:hypothetical protein
LGRERERDQQTKPWREKKRQTDLISVIVESKGTIVVAAEPVGEVKGDLAEVFLLQHVLSPYDEFEGAEFISEGEVYRELKGGILGGVDGAGVLLDDGSVEAGVQDGYDDVAGTGSAKEGAKGKRRTDRWRGSYL